MKRHGTTLLSGGALSLALALPLSAAAAERDRIAEPAADDVRASALKGAHISAVRITGADESRSDMSESDLRTLSARSSTAMGEVSDLLIASEGRMRGVMIDVGGALGFGERTVALPASKLQSVRSPDGPDRVLVHPGASEMPNDAPAFQTSSADRFGEALQMPKVDPRQGTILDAASVSEAVLVGAAVVGSDDEIIGSVARIEPSQDGGRRAVLEIGGWLGFIGAREISVPMDKVAIVRSSEASDLRVHVSATREQLRNMPGRMN